MTRLALPLLAALSLASCAKSTRPPATANVYEPIIAAELQGLEGESYGLVTFNAAEDQGVTATTSIHGLQPYSMHGLHIHQGATCTGKGFSQAGGHFAPDGDLHGSPELPDNSHAGDLGNVTANKDGVALVKVVKPQLTLFEGSSAVLGHAVVLHAGRDDMETQPSGDSGARMACGVAEVFEAGSPEDIVYDPTDDGQVDIDDAELPGNRSSGSNR